jgi:isoleucyl-tRNA synthetase
MLPNLRLLGPRLGPRLREVRPLLEAGEVERLEDGGFRVAGEVLSPEEVIQGERHELPGWATAEDNGISVAFDVELDDELRTEGRVLDLIHAVNALRKSSGIEITDRVALTLPESQADLLAHADWIAREVLATDVDVDGDLDEPAIEKVEAAERA